VKGVRSAERGVALSLRAQPGSRRNELRFSQQSGLKVAVTQIAEKGKANRAITKVLAKSLGLRRSQIELVAGHTNALKQFLIRDVTVEQLEQRIHDATG